MTELYRKAKLGEANGVTWWVVRDEQAEADVRLAQAVLDVVPLCGPRTWAEMLDAEWPGHTHISRVLRVIADALDAEKEAINDDTP